jgi:hypothetical protein
MLRRSYPAFGCCGGVTLPSDAAAELPCLRMLRRSYPAFGCCGGVTLPSDASAELPCLRPTSQLTTSPCPVERLKQAHRGVPPRASWVQEGPQGSTSTPHPASRIPPRHFSLAKTAPRVTLPSGASSTKVLFFLFVCLFVCLFLPPVLRRAAGYDFVGSTTNTCFPFVLSEDPILKGTRSSPKGTLGLALFTWI